MLVSAVAQLLGVLIWPLVMLFFLVRFRGLKFRSYATAASQAASTAWI